ncbi:uncharacterized protein L201_001085 [Kwoniella dendrophila CBS 6074]|uniref:Zn(2)-C6 fungal-type domain-containing protein n=1 Tax=Kwoniella dendrophila CBS 6074 TaxID=1295534 RepID=A0AAX4JLA7_9TREE
MGGDHKCPLCSATFTRPQHVGRHLRAHTGDRPYECKECPLRFARSDLLSRHVNKAHRPPDANAPPKEKTAKKGRRKSMPASATKKPDMKIIQASSDKSSNNNGDGNPTPAQNFPKPRSASFNQTTQSLPHPQLQAQSMYPHHPLLTNPSNAVFNPQVQNQTWSTNPSQAYATTAAMTSTLSSSPYGQAAFVNPATGTGNPNAILGMPAYTTNPNNVNTVPTFNPPFTAAPMKITGSEQGYSSIGQVPVHNSNGILYEWGFKKRACDQCNHSKVRCDFADPCLRCTHRNIKCSYNKPQRSRTFGYPLVPSQTAGSTAGVTINTSPQSQLSSPPTVNNPIGHPQGPGQHHPRNNSLSSLPLNYPVSPVSVPVRQWGSFSNSKPSGTANSWPATQDPMAQSSYSNLPLGTAPGSITGQIQPSPVPMNASLQNSAYQGVNQYQGTEINAQEASPQQGTATTPSLTNNTTSPPDIDEPFERRSSYTGTTGSFLSGQEWQDQGQSFKGPTVAPTLQTHNSDPTYIVPFNSSPVQYSPTQINQISSNIAFVPEQNYQWPASLQSTQFVNPNWQARQDNNVPDDENASVLSSSAHSTFIDLSEAPSQSHHRRRSSAGQWANAMAQMSLQDPLNSTESSVIPLPDAFVSNGIIDPSFDVQPQHGFTQNQRPSFPTLTGVAEETEAESQPMPSLSDVKDLWRLFMTEPMTGLTPMGESHNNELETMGQLPNNGPLITPRPGMGKRTLSKSNSMPDLQSPMVNGPQFFNNFLNGLTPKPTESQNSYIPNHIPSSNDNQGSDNADIRKWSKEIQQRQSSFSLSGQPSSINNKLGKTTSSQSISNLSSQNVNTQSQRRNSRPLPSVVQRSSATALEQTLAPERIPSFGISQSFLGTGNIDSYSNSGFIPSDIPNPATVKSKVNNAMNSNKSLSGIPSHMARPGNKRLASQTLVGDTGKKTTFTLYDDETSFSNNANHELSQQHKLPNHTMQQPPIQTQANSMFYPNWSLNPQSQLPTQPQPVNDQKR